MNPWLFTVEYLCSLEGLISKYIEVIVLSVNIFVSVQLSHFYWKHNSVFLLQSERLMHLLLLGNIYS
jgi:hypothetical protein